MWSLVVSYCKLPCALRVGVMLPFFLHLAGLRRGRLLVIGPCAQDGNRCEWLGECIVEHIERYLRTLLSIYRIVEHVASSLFPARLASL